MELFGRKTVISTRFRSVFVASMVSMISTYILTLTDNVVAGQIVGDDAVAAMTLVFPLFTLILFMSYVISDGLIMMASYANGRGDRDEVDRLFSLGMILSVGASLIFFAALILLREPILSFWEISPYLQTYARDYYDGLKFMALVEFVNIFLYTIFVAEGMENECVKASGTAFVVNVVLDIILCKTIGVMGIGLGTTLGTLASLLVQAYYLRRSNLHFVWYWNTKKTWQGIFYSFYHSIDTLCQSLLPLILSYEVILRFGEGELIVVTVVVNFLTLIIAVYTGLVDCLQPMVCQYHAEKNLHSMIKTMRIGIGVTVAVSLLIIALGMIFADFLPAMFGVREPYMENLTARALRFFMPFTVFMGVSLMLANYYIYIEKLNFGALIKILLLLILPYVMMRLVGPVFPTQFFWLCFGASFLVSFLLNLLFVKFFRGRANVLLIDEKKLARQLSYDVDTKAEEILAVTKQAEEDLARLGVSEKTRNRLVLFIEEFGLHAVERAGEKIFQLEFSILLEGNDSATLIIRDDGEPFDVVKNAQEEQFDFREYFIESVTVKTVSRSYYSSGDENRVVLKI